MLQSHYVDQIKMQISFSFFMGNFRISEIVNFKHDKWIYLLMLTSTYLKQINCYLCKTKFLVLLKSYFSN